MFAPIRPSPTTPSCIGSSVGIVSSPVVDVGVSVSVRERSHPLLSSCLPSHGVCHEAWPRRRVSASGGPQEPDS